MPPRNDLQSQNIQLDMIDPKDPESLLQFMEWAKQTSAKLKELQRQIDLLNKWVYPK